MAVIYWRAVDFLCRLLEPNERDVVRGDLTESGETGGRALVGVLGLVLRRQTALWKAWQPWSALAGIAVPIGWSLGLTSWVLSHYSANYILAYARQWDNPIIREDFPGFAANTLFSWSIVSCVSWISSFGLGFISRRTIPITAALYGSAMLAGYVMFPHSMARAHHWPPVFGSTPYEPVPLTVLAVVVVFPSVLGIRLGLRLDTHRPFIRTILRAATITTLAMLFPISAVNLWRVTGAVIPPPIWDLATHRLNSVAVLFGLYWPLVYLIGIAIARCRQSRGAREIAGT
jgi:hypothetical protein